MKQSQSIIIILLCIISIPFIYIKLTPKNNEIVVLPGLEIPKPIVTPSATSSTYINIEYGFSLTLPVSWNGFSTTTTKIPDGIEVRLRHPLSTAQSPRMDIPVLVYPLAQWTKWEKTNFEDYPTAAPIGPTERARNTKYVFATAPRYNFSFLPGFEEVEDIFRTLQGS
jgi:hypothetical protein